MSTKRSVVGFLGVGLAVLVGCSGSPDSPGSSGQNLTSPSTSPSTAMKALFANVKPGQPLCFEQSYSAAHLASYPKQTVTTMRVELSNDILDANDASISFVVKSEDTLNYKELNCVDKGGKTICSVDGCDSSVELTKPPSGGNGLRVINQNLRAGGASGSCDQPKPLDPSRGADDVFDLVASACNDSVLCLGILQSRNVANCTELTPLSSAGDCGPDGRIVRAGDRWTDESQFDAVQNGKAGSEDACWLKYSSVATVDGCCGG